MARDAQRREDLLRDARALTPRILLRFEMDGGSVDVLAGFRGDALSLYFGDDPVFHFNARGELRRAFAADRLIKAESGKLIALEPKRTPVKTEFQPTTVAAVEEQQLFFEVNRRLSDLRGEIAAGRFQIIGQEPKDSDALSRLERWLTDGREIRVACSPRVGG